MLIVKRIGRYLPIWGSNVVGGVALVMFILLVVASIEGDLYGIYHDHQQVPCYHYSHYIDLPFLVTFFYRTIINVDALWTAIASIVGIMALWGIYAQIRLTQVSTKETKRSVDAYVDSQRGMIALYASAIDRYFKKADTNRQELPAYRIVYALRNIGPSSLFIITHDDRVTAEPLGSKEPPVEKWMGESFSNLLLTPNRCYATEHASMRMKVPIEADTTIDTEIPDDVVEKVKAGTHYLLWRVAITYKSVMGGYYFSGISLKAENMDERKLQFVEGHGNFDIPDPAPHLHAIVEPRLLGKRAATTTV